MQQISEALSSGILEQIMDAQKAKGDPILKACKDFGVRSPVDMEERDRIREFERRQKIAARSPDDHAERVAKMEAKLERRAKAAQTAG